MLPVERRKPGVGAHRHLARGSGIGAIEARPGCGRRRGLGWGGGAGWGAGTDGDCGGVGGTVPFASVGATPHGGRGRSFDACQRRQRRDDRIGVAEQDDRAGAVGRLLHRIVDVRRQRSAAADHRNARRQVDRQRPEQLTAPVLPSSLSMTGFSIRTTASGRDLVEGRLVAPSELRRAAEQLALDEVVSGAARAQLLRLPGCRALELAAGQFVLIGVPVAGEIAATSSTSANPPMSAMIVQFASRTGAPNRPQSRSGSLIRAAPRAGARRGPCSPLAARCASRPAPRSPLRAPASGIRRTRCRRYARRGCRWARRRGPAAACSPAPGRPPRAAAHRRTAWTDDDRGARQDRARRATAAPVRGRPEVSARTSCGRTTFSTALNSGRRWWN